MTTPKEALRPFAACIFNDNGDITIDTSHLRTEDYMRAKSALASLQGEDAVERVARIPHAEVDKIVSDLMSANYSDKQRLAVAIGRAIVKANERGLATGLVLDEAAVRADSTANLISIIADIREKTGLGGKPMLNELADAIVAEMDRRVADEREKMLDKVCENLIVLSRGDESIIGAARVALNNAAVFICGADRAKRAIRSGGGE